MLWYLISMFCNLFRHRKKNVVKFGKWTWLVKYHIFSYIKFIPVMITEVLKEYQFWEISEEDKNNRIVQCQKLSEPT